MSSINTQCVGQVVHIYAPLIKNSRKVAVLYDTAKGFYAQVDEGGCTYQVPFKGLILPTLDKMQHYLRHTYLEVHKNGEGIPQSVSACVKGVGGMLRNAHTIKTLPVYDGYAIGNLIRKDRLLLPLIQRDFDEVSAELEEAFKEKEQIENQKRHLPAPPKGKKPAKEDEDEEDFSNYKIQIYRDKIQTCNQRIIQAKKEFTDLKAQLEAFGKRGRREIGWEETLPLDFSRSTVRTDNRSFPGERMRHVVFNRQQADRAEVQKEIETLITTLFQKDVVSRSFISADELTSLAGSITDMIAVETKVALVGSFVKLSRVRIMDPIVLRPRACSPQLVQNAGDYCVITEAVLGALFLGFGKHVEVSAKLSEEQIMTQMTVFSFFSQGAIPQVSSRFQDTNLWSVYCNWKEILASDEHSGYPISLRARELTVVLAENGIRSEPKEDSEKIAGAV